MMTSTGLLQLANPPDQLFQVVLGILIAVVIISAVILVAVRENRRSARIIDQLLLEKMTISLLDLRSILQKPRLDVDSLQKIVRSCRNALQGFTGTTIVSYPLLRERLRRLLHDDSIVKTSQEADMWSLPDATVGEIIESVASEERIDVIRTRTGDYVVVSFLKSRFHDDLQFQGRIDIRNEAQRLGVEQSDLAELVYSWGWDLIEISDEALASTDWIRVVLERMVISQGYLNPYIAAEQIGVTTEDIGRLLKRLDWKTIPTEDGNLVPVHIIDEYLRNQLERTGLVNLTEASKSFRLSLKSLIKLLKQIDRQIIETKHGEMVTLDFIRRQIKTSMRIAGWARPEDIADLLGVSSRLVIQILHSDEEYRRVPDGRYISLRYFRDWLIELIKDRGIIPLETVEHQWGITPVELRVLIKRFGIKTTGTISGNLLSIQWARDKIRAKLNDGISVSPNDIAKEFGVDVGVAVALVANTESAAYQTRDGQLVPESVLRDKLREQFVAKGVIDPEKEAHRLGLDVSVIERLVDTLAVDSVESRSGARVSIAGLMKYVRKRLDDNGIADLALISEKAGIDYETLSSLVERQLTGDETVIDSARCVVRSDWVKSVLEPLTSTGQILVTEFAKKHHIRRSAALHILRSFLRGAYLKSRDLFITVPSA